MNTAIYLHGTSGSATGTRALVAALRELPATEVVETAPPSRGGRTPLLNAVADARWDLWQAGRSVPEVDLLVSPCNIGLRGRAKRHLLVVHDVMPLQRPELFDRNFAAYFRLLVPPSVRRADRVLTLSEHSAVALRRMAPGADVRVVSWLHEGGPAQRVRFATATTPVAGAGPRPTVLMVGATEPVKNQAAGVLAVRQLRDSSGVDVRLRVLGPTGRAEGAVCAALAAVDPDGTWGTREVDVPREVLESAYASSWVLLQPSHDEGFGLPLVEAARHGLPSVHSGRGAMPTVMPEVDAGGVSPDLLARALQPLLSEPRWNSVAALASARAEAFSPAAFHETVRAQVADLLPDPA